MTWLFVTTRFPWPIVDGHWLRVYHLARTLRDQGDRAAVLSFQGDDEGMAGYRDAGVEVLSGPHGSHVSRGPGRSMRAPYAFDRRLAQAVAEHAPAYDVTVLSGIRMLQYAPEASRGRCPMVDIGDDPVLEYRRRRNGAKGLRGWVRQGVRTLGRLRFERRFLANVTTATFITEVDCRSFMERHQRLRSAVVPNGVDVDYFRRPLEHAAAATGTTLVFTGHMSNPNNERAAEFLAREVAPLVWRRHPEVRVQIVGADPTDTVRSLASERVEVTGRVEDLRPYIWNAGVVVLPMQSGTGIKNKLLEAWAAEAAVVATPLACQGIPARDGENLLLGDSANCLAKRIDELLGNEPLRRAVASQGRQSVEKNLTWGAAAAQLRAAALITW